MITQPPHTNTPMMASSGEAGLSDVATTTTTVEEEDEPQMSLMEMMDKLTNSVDYEKPEMSQAAISTCGSGSAGCSCKDLNEGVAKGCCIVICLKTLEALKFLVMQKETLQAVACKPQSAAPSAAKKRKPSMLARSNFSGRCNNNNMACCGSPALCN